MAVTTVAALSVTTHVPVPEQPPPLQPLKALPVAADAASVTDVPAGTVSEQSLPAVPQAMAPAGTDVTPPMPSPAVVTVSVTLGTVTANSLLLPLAKPVAAAMSV